MGAAALVALAAARPASRWYALLLAACVTLARESARRRRPRLAAVVRRGGRHPGCWRRCCAGRSARSRARWPRASPSRSRPRWPPRRWWRTTSARSRWPGCPPTCWRCRWWRRSCGWAWCAPRWPSSAPSARPLVDLARPARWRRCLAALAGLATAFAGMPGGQLRPTAAGARGGASWPTRVAGAAVAAIARLASAACDPRPRGRRWRRAPGPAGARRSWPSRARWRRSSCCACARAAGAARRAHRLLPRRRPGRRHPDPGTRAAWPSCSTAARPRRASPGCCAGRGCATWRWWWPPTSRATTTAGLPAGGRAPPRATRCSRTATAPATPPSRRGPARRGRGERASSRRARARRCGRGR